MSFKEALVKWADDIMYMFGEPRRITKNVPIQRDEWFSDRMKLTTENAKDRIRVETIRNAEHLILLILKKVEIAANNGLDFIIIDHTGFDPNIIKERLKKDFRLSCRESWFNSHKRLIIDWMNVKEAVIEENDEPIKKIRKKKKISLKDLK